MKRTIPWRRWSRVGPSPIACSILAAFACAGALAQTGFGDLDGDGWDEIVLRHATDRTWIAYDLSGEQPVEQRVGATSNADYRFAGMGDFDGDGADELVLRHATSGAWIRYAIEDGRTVLHRIGGATPNLAYELAGIGDFDGDGADELLLRHATQRNWISYAVTGTRASLRRPGATRNPDYVFAGIGDVDGDSADELLLRHVTSHAWIGYDIDGSRVTLRRFGGKAPGLDYDVIGAGDLDGDGADELLFRNPDTGSWKRFALEDQRVVPHETVGLTANRRYVAAGVGDFDGDGADDVLVRHAENGSWFHYAWAAERATGRRLVGITDDPLWRPPFGDAEPAAVPASLGDVGTMAEERSRLFGAVGRDVFSVAYAEFDSGAGNLQRVIDGYCASPAADDAPLRDAWRLAMLAWQRAQHIYVGPARDDPAVPAAWRIQFFPPRNVERDVRNALADTEPLNEARIANAPVGLQGLPALEFLIFSIGGLDDATEGPRRCELAKAVSANVATVAGEVADGWAEDASFLSDFVNATGVFNMPEDVLVEILTALAQHAEFIGDRKLKSALELGNAQSLESHYAEHSGENLQANVEAFRALFDSRHDGGYRLRDYLERVHSADSITEQIAERLDTAEDTLAAYEASLEQIVAGNAAGDTETLFDTFQRLADLGVDAAVAAGVELGFNNQDGD